MEKENSNNENESNKIIVLRILEKIKAINFDNSMIKYITSTFGSGYQFTIDGDVISVSSFGFRVRGLQTSLEYTLFINGFSFTDNSVTREIYETCKSSYDSIQLKKRNEILSKYR